MTGADGPLTKSESETEYLAEKFMPEGSARPVVVQSGLSNETISLEGFARRDSGAANLILSEDAHALAATPERVVTVGDFGDIVGQKATIYHGMSLADGWENHPRRDPSPILRYAEDGTRRALLRAGRDDSPRDVKVYRRDRE